MASFTYSYTPIPLNMVCARCNCRKGLHREYLCPSKDGKGFLCDGSFISSNILRTIKCDRNRNPERYRGYPK